MKYCCKRCGTRRDTAGMFRPQRSPGAPEPACACRLGARSYELYKLQHKRSSPVLGCWAMLLNVLICQVSASSYD